jgi:predicted SAM-dependent methyltransferase
MQRKEQIKRYVESHPIRKVQLGAGSNALKGWLNTEGFVASSFTHSLSVAENYILLDVREKFPFSDNSVDFIFHEHVIEHLPFHKGLFMLSECFRILKPGGRIRVATPDIQVFIETYGSNASPDHQRFASEYVRFNSGVWSADLAHVRNNHSVFSINHALRAWGHEFLYDFSTLKEVAETAGFVDITREKPQISSEENLSNLEYRKEFVGIFDALIIEGRKPLS